MIHIYDNYLDKAVFNRLQEFMLSAEIPWFKNSTLVEQPNILEESWNYQFTHVFYRSYSPTSELLSHIDPLLIKINPAAIIRVKDDSTDTRNP